MRRKVKNVIKSDIIKNDIQFKILNKKIKAKSQRYRNMKTQKDKNLVFQKNRQKIQTYVNLYQTK